MTLVSVVIPTHNRARLLKDAIESVLAVHRDGFDLDVIVVDDGSTDNTAAVVAAYPVVYLRTAGLGSAGARNAGMEAARGEYIAFLDDDDVWLPHNIATQVHLLKQQPTFGAAYAQVLLTGPDRVPYGDPVPAGPLPSGWIFDDLLTHWPQLGSVVVRATVAREIGGQDLSLFGDQDWDWLLRIAHRYQIGRIEQPVMLFRQRQDADEALSWRRMACMIEVFRRHTRHYGPRPRRVLWRHRGWYAAAFLHTARVHAHQGARTRALRSFSYALRASPLHVAILLARSGLQRVSRP